MNKKKHEIRVDRDKPLRDQAHLGHNRWHPDIPPILSVDPGDIVVIECLDAIDGQLSRHSTHEDVSNMNSHRVHPLTGPISVNGAEPGDLLEVKIIDVESSDFGVAEISPGFGFLRESFPNAYLTRWELDGGFATSEDLPGVRIPGNPFMGVMGVAPSRSLMEQIKSRESELDSRGGKVAMPDPKDAIPAVEPIASEGLRTSAPEEFGGNFDIKALTKGTNVLLPVFVPGALFSAGDGHFAQGDGEVCGTAIETANTVTLQFGLRKGAAEKQNINSVQFERSEYFAPPEQAVPRRFYATTGMPITNEGRNESEDLTLATKNALLSMIDHLVTSRNYNREQAYILCSLTVDLRVAECVDLPNVMVTAYLPLDIFTTEIIKTKNQN